MSIMVVNELHNPDNGVRPSLIIGQRIVIYIVSFPGKLAIITY